MTADLLADVRAAIVRDPDASSARHAALIAIARAAGWPVGHVWVPTSAGWVSAHQWYDDDRHRYAELRACVESEPAGPARGHVATALHLQMPRVAENLGMLHSVELYRRAMAAGLVAGVAVPIVNGVRTVAVMDFLLSPGQTVDEKTIGQLADASELLVAMTIAQPELQLQAS